jgi:GGDEF domain-containing protein
MHIQRAVGALELEVRPGVALKVTISGGVAVSPEDGATYDDLFAAADRRMYEDKERTKRSDWQSPGSTLPLAG